MRPPSVASPSEWAPDVGPGRPDRDARPIARPTARHSTVTATAVPTVSTAVTEPGEQVATEGIGPEREPGRRAASRAVSTTVDGSRVRPAITSTTSTPAAIQARCG